MISMDSHDLVTVYTVTNPAEAEIIRSFLESEGIRCFLAGLNTALASFFAQEIRIQVPAPDADRARTLINSHQARHKGPGAAGSAGQNAAKTEARRN